MPAYHSSFNDENMNEVCGMLLLPINSKVKGPCPPGNGKEDIIDEALKFYRANVLFASFEVQGGADRVLLFLTLYISQCLKRLEKAGSKDSANKILFELAKEKFPLPGENGWLLGGHILRPKGRAEEDLCRSFMKQIREETGIRLLEILYKDNPNVINKHWMAFSKRKFMNILVR